MGFLTCWLILPMGQPLRVTSWGILSGLFWVPGGVAGIYGIRTAGLAVAVGTWSSLIVLTSFCWGVFVFEERVKSTYGACCACATLIAGLVGMSIYSRPTSSSSSSSHAHPQAAQHRTNNGAKDPGGGGGIGGGGGDGGIGGGGSMIAIDEDGMRKRVHVSSNPKDDGNVGTTKMAMPSMAKAKKMTDVKSNNDKVASSSSTMQQPLLPSLEMECLLSDIGGRDDDEEDDDEFSQQRDNKKSSWTTTIRERQITLSRRQVGLLACLFNGEREEKRYLFKL